MMEKTLYYNVLKKLKNMFCNPVWMPVKTHVAAPALDELTTTHSETSSHLPAVIGGCTGPLRTGLGAAYIACGGQTWPKWMLTYTYAEAEKALRGTLPSYAIGYDIKRLFPIGKPRKRGPALRASFTPISEHLSRSDGKLREPFTYSVAPIMVLIW